MIGVQQEALFPPPLPIARRAQRGSIVVRGLAGGDLRQARFHRRRR